MTDQRLRLSGIKSALPSDDGSVVMVTVTFRDGQEQPTEIATDQIQPLITDLIGMHRAAYQKMETAGLLDLANLSPTNPFLVQDFQLVPAVPQTALAINLLGQEIPSGAPGQRSITVQGLDSIRHFGRRILEVADEIEARARPS
jgi:hypothetical protein